MRVTATDRFIRLLIALAGGDANQVELPPLKRPMHIVVQRTPDNGRLVVIAPEAITGDSARLSSAGGSLVYLTGEALGRPAPDSRELQVQVQPTEPPVTVRVPTRNCAQVLPGNVVFVQGRLVGNIVEATVLSVVDVGTAGRQRQSPLREGAAHE